MREPDQTTAQITLHAGWPDPLMSVADRARELIGMLHDQGKLPPGFDRGVRLLAVQLHQDEPFLPWGGDIGWFGQSVRAVVLRYMPMRGGDDAADA